MRKILQDKLYLHCRKNVLSLNLTNQLQGIADTFIKYYYKFIEDLRELQKEPNSFLKVLFVHHICNIFYIPTLARLDMLYPPSKNKLNIWGAYATTELYIMNPTDTGNQLWVEIIMHCKYITLKLKV